MTFKSKLSIITLAVFAALNLESVSAAEPIYGDNSGQSAIALGWGSSSTEYESIAIGVSSSSTGHRAISIGVSSKGPSVNAMALGNWSAARGESSVALGTSSQAVGFYSMALGPNARVGSYTDAQGTEGQDGYVPAQTVSYNRAVALGPDSIVETNGGVALGASSVANRSSGVTGVSFNGEADSSITWRSGEGAVSVGSSTVTRQITGVAAGSEDTDAVNVAQLKSLKAYTDGELATVKTYTDSELATVKENTIIGTGASNLISEATEAIPGDEENGIPETPAQEAKYAQNAVAFRYKR